MRFLGCIKAWSCIVGNVGTCFGDLREKKVYLSCVLVQNWDTEQKLCYNKCPYLCLNITPVTLHPSDPPSPRPAGQTLISKGSICSRHHLLPCLCAAEPRLKVSEGEGALNLTATGLISAPLPCCSPSPSLTHHATTITHTHRSSRVSSCSPPVRLPGLHELPAEDVTEGKGTGTLGSGDTAEANAAEVRAAPRGTARVQATHWEHQRCCSSSRA